MPHNFTAWDIAATSIAFPLFALFLVIPGYVLGAWLDIFAFSRRTLLARVAISVCLSIAVVPVAVYLCWLSMPAMPWLLCAASWVAFPIVVWRSQPIPRRGPLSRQRAIVLAILAGWVVLGALVLIDLQIGRRLYFPVSSYDYTLRAAITAAIDRTGVPPTNPYFYPGHGYVLRYHYFWYMLCSLVGRFGGPFVTARIAVIGGTLWSGIGLVAIVALYVHLSRSKRSANPDKQMLVAVALLSVTGLDILPLVVTFLLSGRFNASSEWWNEPVLSWVNSVFWQPHSIAALVACATGLLIIWDASRHSERRFRLSGAAVGGAAFASGLGLSVYVTFVFGVCVMAWVVTLLFRGRRRAASVTFIAGVLALVMSIPYLFELSGKGPGSARAPSSARAPIGFAIRSFYFAEALVGEFGPGNGWRVPLANAVSLPLNYFLEFGFFFVVGIKQWKRIRDRRSFGDEEVCGVTMLAGSIIICTFLRSNTISFNDLGWRGIIVAQFVLLIWGAELWENGLFPARKTRFGAVGVMLALGAAATVYDVTMLRIYPILLDDLAIPRYSWLARDHSLGQRTYALREVYDQLRNRLPERAIVQHNPNAAPGDLFYGLYADRQTAAENSGCGVVFGGDPSLCARVIGPLNELFDKPDAVQADGVDRICRDLGVDALVVKDTDKVWADGHGWVWKKRPDLANDYARVFCRVPGSTGGNASSTTLMGQTPGTPRNGAAR